MKTHQKLQLGGAIIETSLAIPFMSGMFIIAFVWMPLLLALIYHIVALVFAVRGRGMLAGNVLGILANTLGFIPIVGWILHTLASIFLYISAFRKE